MSRDSIGPVLDDSEETLDTVRTDLVAVKGDLFSFPSLSCYIFSLCTLWSLFVSLPVGLSCSVWSLHGMPCLVLSWYYLVFSCFVWDNTSKLDFSNLQPVRVLFC